MDRRGDLGCTIRYKTDCHWGERIGRTVGDGVTIGTNMPESLHYKHSFPFRLSVRSTSTNASWRSLSLGFRELVNDETVSSTTDLTVIPWARQHAIRT